MSWINNPNFLPTVMIVISAAAAIRYGFSSDYGRCVYFMAGAVITFSATWMKFK